MLLSASVETLYDCQLRRLDHEYTTDSYNCDPLSRNQCVILKASGTADQFGIETKTVIKVLLKLWLFEVAKSYGSHFEKKALKDFVSFCIFFFSNMF